MIYSITPPARIDADLLLPASKSISARALIIQALCHDKVLPTNISSCDDTDVMVIALRDMPTTINIKAAGTAMRFLTAYLSVMPGEHIITGTERMKHRPISILVDALRYLGADINYEGEEGFPPLRIRGRQLEGGTIDVDGSVSSQYISALLMVAPMMKRGLELNITGEIASHSYIDLTLWTMKEYGADADWTDADTIVVRPKPYIGCKYTIENDWSASSYWYETLALTDDHEAKIRLSGLFDGSKQGDSVVRYIFYMLGVKTSMDMHGATLSRHTRTMPRFDYDFISSPDLTQTVVVSCCLLGIPFHFTGLANLKVKETDRIEALKSELRKLGYILRDLNDSELFWDGERCEPTEEPIDTYEDHRMAMAFAPACMKRPGLKIRNPEVVSKSYPLFWEEMRKAGFIIKEVNE